MKDTASFVKLNLICIQPSLIMQMPKELEKQSLDFYFKGISDIPSVFLCFILYQIEIDKTSHYHFTDNSKSNQLIYVFKGISDILCVFLYFIVYQIVYAHGIVTKIVQ